MKYWFPGVPAAAAVVAVALLSGGCSGSGGSAFPPPVEKQDLTVAAVPVADSAAVYIAEQRGLFRAEGLNVKIVPAVSGATAIAGQLAGTYDVVLGNYVSYILADAQYNDKFRILAPGSAEGPGDSMLLVPPNSPIQAVADLKGRTIGVNALNNIGTLLLSSVLNDNGMPVQGDRIHFKAIPFPDMSRALQAHQVDAAWLVEPFVTYAEMAGAQPLADTDQGNTLNFPVAGYMVTQSWEQKYPKTAAAFRTALREGQKIASLSSPAVQRGLEAFAGVPTLAASIITRPSYPLAINPRSIQRVADLMLLYGMLGHTFDASQMLH
jgi:NitT/TauT family transport system substrate-binding protein